MNSETMALIPAFFLLGLFTGAYLGERIGYWFGVLGGYGATRWPDSPYFGNARKIINKARRKDGLCDIEHERIEV